MNESQLVRTIKAHIERGDKAKDKAEQHYIAAGQHLKELKGQHSGSWAEWEELLKDKIGIGKGTDAEEKYVLHFEGDTKPMVLNRTNWEALEDAFGDSDNWPGHKVKIKTARTNFQGKAVDGIRVEPIVPKPALKNDLNDEIAF